MEATYSVWLLSMFSPWHFTPQYISVSLNHSVSICVSQSIFSPFSLTSLMLVCITVKHWLGWEHLLNSNYHPEVLSICISLLYASTKWVGWKKWQNKNSRKAEQEQNPGKMCERNWGSETQKIKEHLLGGEEDREVEGNQREREQM